MAKMTFEEFCRCVDRKAEPVVLLEGTRGVPANEIPRIERFAAALARRFPRIQFRTGNAPGSDEAFARGVETVDATRLEYVLPYAGHRGKACDGPSRRVAMTDLSAQAEERAARHSAGSSPQYRSMLERRDAAAPLRARSRYIMRDTIKVIGAGEARLRPATAAIFFANPQDSMKGGTGHTIRVCRDQGVPVALQDEWMAWPVG
jgi:hypothetical protein